jgi:hypothetical protein
MHGCVWSKMHFARVVSAYLSTHKCVCLKRHLTCILREKVAAQPTARHPPPFLGLFAFYVWLIYVELRVSEETGRGIWHFPLIVWPARKWPKVNAPLITKQIPKRSFSVLESALQCLFPDVVTVSSFPSHEERPFQKFERISRGAF